MAAVNRHRKGARFTGTVINDDLEEGDGYFATHYHDNMESDSAFIMDKLEYLKHSSMLRRTVMIIRWCWALFCEWFIRNQSFTLLLLIFANPFQANPFKHTTVFQVETTWRQSCPCYFNVEYTWCVCRNAAFLHPLKTIWFFQGV